MLCTDSNEKSCFFKVLHESLKKGAITIALLAVAEGKTSGVSCAAAITTGMVKKIPKKLWSKSIKTVSLSIIFEKHSNMLIQNL